MAKDRLLLNIDKEIMQKYRIKLIEKDIKNVSLQIEKLLEKWTKDN